MVRDIEERAAAMVARGEEPRKHHLVPRFYLQRWAQDGQLRVTDLETRASFLSSPATAGRRTDFYRFEDGARSRGTAIDWEVFLSGMEGKIAATFRRMLDDEVPVGRLPVEEQVDLVWFIALQATRGVNFRRQLQWSELQDHASNFERLGDAYLRVLLIESGVDAHDDEVAAAREQLEGFIADPTKYPVPTWAKLQQAAHVAPVLVDFWKKRSFVVYRTPPRLVTSDEPVTMLHAHLGDPGEASGSASAPIIVLPLAPDAVLAMFAEGFPIRLPSSTELSVEDTLDLNQAVLGNAYAYGFEQPRSRLAGRLFVPPRPAAGYRRVIGEGPDGEELHEMRLARRWDGQSGAPVRPVAGWW